MSETLAVLVYAGFAIVIFAVAMFWNKYRHYLKRKLKILHYHPDADDQHHA